MSDFSFDIQSLVGIGLFVLMLAAFFKIKTSKYQPQTRAIHKGENELEEGELFGTEEDRLRSEQALAVPEFALKQHLLESHTFAERFDTLHGFTDRYMTELVTELEKLGVSSTYLFQEATTTGVASMIGRHGLFELYVRNEHRENAQSSIAAAREKLGTN